VAGADLIPFNTIKDKHLPTVDALFIGGGFPETHLEQLEANSTIRHDIYNAIEKGLPVYAECGGLMYLSKSIKWKNKHCQMVGAIKGDIIMEEKPQGRGYVQLRRTGQGLWPSDDRTIETPNIISGHEFHYSRLENIDAEVKYAFDVVRGHGINGKSDGIIYKNLQANYAHLRDTKGNHWARHFVEFIRNVKA
jgi:cobyrinic acid a,c-diamide synthase